MFFGESVAGAGFEVCLRSPAADYDATVFVPGGAPNEDWRRGDSNPRPETFQAGLLRV
jgi:hypothetical protein